MNTPAALLLDAHTARELTERIRSSVESLWRLLELAHDGRAWEVLGYNTWESYVNGEFAMSKSRSYQLLDQAHITRELQAAAGESTTVDLNEHQTRAIKPRLVDGQDDGGTLDPASSPSEPLQPVVRFSRCKFGYPDYVIDVGLVIHGRDARRAS